jgi:hypothetical protein
MALALKRGRPSAGSATHPSYIVNAGLNPLPPCGPQHDCR